MKVSMMHMLFIRYKIHIVFYILILKLLQSLNHGSTIDNCLQIPLDFTCRRLDQSILVSYLGNSLDIHVPHPKAHGLLIPLQIMMDL